MRKTLGLGITFLAVAVMLTLAGSTTQAFHSGGVAECNGCHSMHSAKTPGSFLLKGTDPSSTCLSCHQSSDDTGPNGYHISTVEAGMPTGTAPLQRTPGGDFGWLKKTYTWVPRSGAAAEFSPGETHGHNIVAADFSYVADTATTAPGGTFLSANLGCTSCHDPHGQIRRSLDGSYSRSGKPIAWSGSYDDTVDPGANEAVGAYRLLRGLNDVSVQGVTFVGVAEAVAPNARAKGAYNRSESGTQTRVAYGANGTNTWGNWCASCHKDMHTANKPNVHPIDHGLSTTYINLYNSYVKSGDLTGSSTSSYNSLVPFAELTGGDIRTLKSHAKNDDSVLNGPTSGAQVTCISCHRAHASGFNDMLRFNLENEYMVYGGVYAPATKASVGQGRTEAEMAAAYYDRPATKFATYQRVLCNKCHAKD